MQHTTHHSCASVVRPQVVFFGESLGPRFFQTLQQDLETCDLLIVMGTSLLVYPFAGLANRVSLLTPRLLLNREPTGPFKKNKQQELFNYRDVAVLGDCDDGVTQLASLLGLEF